MDVHNRYLIVVLGFAGAVLLAVAGLNFILIERSVGSERTVFMASDWQQATRGVTYPPPLNSNRAFKVLRLHDRLPEINAVVFGSSTVLGITAAVLPPPIVAYNFAQTGNPLSSVIGEAEYLLAHGPATLKWFIVPLDWSLGFVFDIHAPPPADLSLRAVRAAPRAGGPSVMQVLEEALSLPRVENLGAAVWSALRSGRPAAAFRGIFLQEAGDDYRCPDGTPARDFDIIFRGTCTGFRFDGSATFANLKPLSTARAEQLVAGARVPSSKYASALMQSGGKPYRGNLDRLAAIGAALRARGGELILFLPPLIVGFERALAEAPHTAEPLRRTKATLDTWARAAGLIILDGGQAERYGCTAAEFVDEHHALPTCYVRMFGRERLAVLRAAPPGLHTVP